MPKLKRRHTLTAAAILARKTQKEIAREFGISQSAVSQRLTAFKRSLTSEQLENFKRAIAPGHKWKPMPISFKKGGV